MKKFITILTAVSMALAVLTSCSQPGSSSGTIDNKGSLESIEFNAPGKFSMIDHKIEKYALIDHEYSTEDYSIKAVYSSGYEENVTASAKIEGSSIKSSKGNLTFLSGNKDGHKYTVTVSYGGKTTTAVVDAYKAGDIKDFKVKQSKFFEGISLANSDIGTFTYMDNSGQMTVANHLPKTGFVKICDKNGNQLTSGTLDAIRAPQKGDAKISYSVYESSQAWTFAIEVLALSEANSLSPYYPSPYVQKGDEVNMSTFASKYLKNYQTYIGNAETYKDSTTKSWVYVTNEKGEENTGFNITVTASRNGKALTSGTFEKGDKVEINVTYKISDSKTISGKKEVEV